jgi:diguanylate cyclase
VRRRVLAVDDDRQILLILEAVLGEEHVVRTTTRGAEALRLLEQEHFDLVVLDLAMPGMGGDLIKREMDARGCRTPVLLVSGEADLPDRAAQLAVAPSTWTS